MAKEPFNKNTQKRKNSTGMVKFLVGVITGVGLAVSVTWFGFSAVLGFMLDQADRGVETINSTSYDICRARYLDETKCLEETSRANCESRIRSVCDTSILPDLPRDHREPDRH